MPAAGQARTTASKTPRPPRILRKKTASLRTKGVCGPRFPSRGHREASRTGESPIPGRNTIVAIDLDGMSYGPGHRVPAARRHTRREPTLIRGPMAGHRSTPRMNERSDDGDSRYGSSSVCRQRCSGPRPCGERNSVAIELGDRAGFPETSRDRRCIARVEPAEKLAPLSPGLASAPSSLIVSRSTGGGGNQATPKCMAWGTRQAFACARGSLARADQWHCRRTTSLIAPGLTVNVGALHHAGLTIRAREGSSSVGIAAAEAPCLTDRRATATNAPEWLKDEQSIARLGK